MIVEDDASLRALYEKTLKLKGYAISGMARDGIEAVEIYKSLPKKPDIVLMDYRMPQKNGLQATKEILEVNPNAIIVFASADNDAKSEALSLGVKGFLNKPFTIRDLYDTLEMLVEEYF